MGLSRRKMLSGGAVAAAGLVVASTVRADEPKQMVAACGISCTVCPLMAAGKCKGCATGKMATEAQIEKKNCPVLKCAAMKKIDFCGTGCKMFASCKKLVGRPYAQEFLDKIKTKLA